MKITTVPADFPRMFARGSIGGAQPKILLRRENGLLKASPSEQEIATRYELCLDLVLQLNAYCERKLRENPGWTTEFCVERVGVGLRKKVTSGEWVLFDEEVSWILNNVASDQLERDGRRRTIEKLLVRLTWYTLDQLQVFSGESVDTVETWIRDGKIFSVKDEDEVLYATFQFDQQGQPLPIIQKVLKLLTTTDGWAIASWFGFKNGWIAELQEGKVVSVAPIEVLGQEDKVLGAAMKSNGTYFA